MDSRLSTSISMVDTDADGFSALISSTALVPLDVDRHAIMTWVPAADEMTWEAPNPTPELAPAQMIVNLRVVGQDQIP